jgi:hypothetical protein
MGFIVWPIVATLVVGLLWNLFQRSRGRKPVDSPSSDAAQISRSIHNAVVPILGETLAGQQGWDFGPPPDPYVPGDEAHTCRLEAEDQPKLPEES